MAKPPKRNDMSDMVHRIKAENAKGFPKPKVEVNEDGHGFHCPCIKCWKLRTGAQ